MADFKAIKAAIPLERAAKLLDLAMEQEGDYLRGQCPACQTHSTRPPLSLNLSKNLYFCHEAQKGGSVIDLAAHVLGIPVKDAAEWLQDTLPHSRKATVPQKPEGRTEQHSQPSPTKPHDFDPAKFASNLIYSEEVRTLDITEDDAARLGIGFHPRRHAVFFPIRNPDGSISGFIGCDAKKQLKLPPQWLPGSGKVVNLKRA